MTKMLIILLFCIVIEAKFKTPLDCGRTTLKDFIVGGDDADANEFPFMVSIQTSRYPLFGNITWHHLCGATILTERWILTSATDFNKTRLSVGTVDIKIDKYIYYLDKYILNGCYEKAFYLHDIALIKTDSDIIELKNDTNVGSICLTENNSELNNNSTELFITGWGISVRDGKDMKEVLQKAITQLQEENYCRYSWLYTNLGYRSIWQMGYKLCITFPNNTACEGDFGGPLVDVRDGRAFQVGIASHFNGNIILTKGIICITETGDCYLRFFCDKSDPIVYTKVSKYIDWIHTSIDKYGDLNETKIKTDCDL